MSRRNNVYKSFGQLRDALASVHLTDAILDGEIVCLDSEGRNVFKDVMRRRGDPIFYAFDFLWLNGAQMISEAPDPAILQLLPASNTRSALCQHGRVISMLAPVGGPL